MLITRSIIEPLIAALWCTERAATGDLSEHIQVTRCEEFGQLQSTLQHITVNLRGLLSSLRDSILQSADAAEELSAVTEQARGAVNSQKAETDLVPTAMNEMTVTVQDAARNTEQASTATSTGIAGLQHGTTRVASILQSSSLTDSSVELTRLDVRLQTLVSTFKLQSREIPGILGG